MPTPPDPDSPPAQQPADSSPEDEADEIVVPPEDGAGGGGSGKLRWPLDKLKLLIAEPLPEDASGEGEKAAQAFGRMSQEQYDEERRGQLLNAYAHDLNLRRDYTPKLFKLVTVWLVFVAIFLVIASVPGVGLKVSDVVLVALLGQSTATVVGLFIVVARWIYPKREGRDG